MNVAGLNLNRNWTVESGASASRVQTQQVIFSEATTTGVESQAVGETVTFSTPQAEVAPKPSAAAGFQSLDAGDRGEARRIMKDLNKKARLFARNDEKQLVRIAPGTAKELLDSGKPIEVVTRVGSEVDSVARSSRSTQVDAHFWTADDVFRSSSSASSRTEKVAYTSSPITEWDSLLWMDDEDAKGVPGTPVLPASGRPVVISNEWESKWAKSSEEYSGFFRVDSDIRSNSGYNRVSSKAEG